jgi:hypothetical protein
MKGLPGQVKERVGGSLMRRKRIAGEFAPADVVPREPAVIAQDHTATNTFVDHASCFTPAVPADFPVGLMIIPVKPEAIVVFRQIMVKTKRMAASLACERNFPEDFPAIVTQGHYV